MALSIEALRKRTEEAEAKAKAATLTDEEQQIADLLEREKKATEDAALAARKRRALEVYEREEAARASLPPGVLVKGLDLTDFFDLGRAPDPAVMPGRGVIVVRSPDAEGYDAAAAEIEHKKRSLSLILVDLLKKNMVYPDIEKDPEGGVFLAFCDGFRPAATSAGDEVYKLGGMRAQVAKRGRA